MCKRGAASRDPLLNLFLEEYHLNLLSVPREHSEVGDLYLYDGKHTGSPGKLASFLAKPFRMPPVARGEKLASITGTLSNSVKVDAGFGLLEVFLAALGATFPISKVKAHWESKGVHHLRFAVEDVRRDSVDTGRLGRALIDNTLSPAHPLYDERNRYYLVTGVARSRSLIVMLEDERGAGIDLGVDVIGIGSIDAGVGVTKGAGGEVKFLGSKLLAFGVELYELFVRGDRIRLRLPDAAVNVRGVGMPADRPQPAFIGGADADVFLNLEQEG